MVLYFFLIGIPAMLTLLLTIHAVAFNGKPERLRLERIIQTEILLRIENVKTYSYEQNGWKNSFPSSLGWETTSLIVARDFILIARKFKFPLFFSYEIRPFIIAKGPESLKERLNFNDIHQPINMRTSNYGEDLEFTIKPSGLFGPLTITVIFEKIGKRQLENLFEILDWR